MTLEAAHCITCGDTAVTGLVVEVDGATATVDVDGERLHVAVELVEPVVVGELLLCHAGIAIEKVGSGP